MSKISYKSYCEHERVFDTSDDMRSKILSEINNQIRAEQIISIQEQWNLTEDTLRIVVYYREEY